MSLSAEFEQLNDEQKAAVRSPGNVVVLAGPGSGKTATLVVKIARLLTEEIKAPAGLACVTYNNEAVGEFRRRLVQFGIAPRRGVFLGTVHSFCLNCILRPYAPLVSKRFQHGISVANDEQAAEALAAAVEEHTPGADPRWLGATITKYRRMRACGEDLSGFGEMDPAIARSLEHRLQAAGLIDFEGMVVSALEIITEHAWIREILVARFPWLLIDEYQDLGGPLHQIVTTLAATKSVRIFAVGDPDQTIYDFTGANPKYLNELVDRDDFDEIRLKFNYRSGQRLIDASQAALAPDQPRGYVAHRSQKDPGRVVFWPCNGMNADFAAKTVEAIKEAQKAGEPLHEIAILYRAAGPMVATIRAKIEELELPFIWERDERFPHGPFTRWLQRAAAWTLTPTDNRSPFTPLLREYLAWSGRSTSDEPSEALFVKAALFEFLQKPADPDAALRPWLLDAATVLNLKRVFRRREETAQDQSDWEKLTSAEAGESISLRTFAGPGQIKDKIVITTLHASKGRQFGAVIIPGCAEGILPPWTWNRRRKGWDTPTPFVLSEVRRLFYVGVTRARRAVHLIHAEQYEGKFGPVRLGRSRLVNEIASRLREQK